MINVCNKKCKFSGCGIIPIFNFKNEKSGIYCYNHKLNDMVDVCNKTCKINNCLARAIYNFPGNSPEFCYIHKLENMVNIHSKTCKKCNKFPCFNYENMKAEYCYDHKLENMIDVKHEKCEICKKRAAYGFPKGFSLRCAQHKIEGMLLNPRSMCKELNCSEIAIYASTFKQAIHCEQHKTKEEINIIEKNCKSCSLPNILNSNNVCTYCDPDQFNSFRLGRQLQVKKFLDINNFNYISYDEAINYIECGDKYKPDFVFESKNGLCKIILEIDEDRHRGYHENCECTRMVNIAQSNGIPTLFIRYNPDSYKVNNIKKDILYNKRMKVLKLVLESALNMQPEEIIGYCCIKQLYYDDFDETNIKWEIITPFDNIDKVILSFKTIKI